jgi:hypothetical protein
MKKQRSLFVASVTRSKYNGTNYCAGEQQATGDSALRAATNVPTAIKNKQSAISGVRDARRRLIDKPTRGKWAKTKIVY